MSAPPLGDPATPTPRRFLGRRWRTFVIGYAIAWALTAVVGGPAAAEGRLDALLVDWEYDQTDVAMGYLAPCPFVILVEVSVQTTDGVYCRAATHSNHLWFFGLGTHVITRRELS